MKKLIICLLAVLLLTGCECSLHTHYFNEYGECICGFDKSIKLEHKDNEYITNKHQIKQGDYYYYKIDTQGEDGLDFYLVIENGETITFDRLEIRGPTIVANDVAGNKYSAQPGKVFTSSRPFANNATYHFKIRYYGEGTIQLRVIERTQ